MKKLGEAKEKAYIGRNIKINKNGKNRNYKPTI